MASNSRVRGALWKVLYVQDDEEEVFFSSIQDVLGIESKSRMYCYLDMTWHY
jgi:hypothetical protein